MTKEEYVKLLNAHDWTFQYSDDSKYYRAGDKEREVLLKLAEDNVEFELLYFNKKQEKIGV